MNNRLRRLTTAALIAALYIVLTWLCSALGIANGAVQLRLSEALNALCLFSPAAVGGMFAGCLISNLLTGCAALDIVFGSLATLLGAWGAYKLRKHPDIALLCPVVSNALILPFVFRFVYSMEAALWYFAVTVAIGQLLSCSAAGKTLYLWLKKTSLSRFFDSV